MPTARAIPSRDGREQLIGDEDIEELRGARLNVGGNPNFATRVMSNGVEVIVASTYITRLSTLYYYYHCYYYYDYSLLYF